jgi:hypothetical protein
VEEFEPFRIQDCDGETHVFHFEARDFGGGIAVDAFEIGDRTEGYEFQVIGPPGSDRLGLVGQLIQKIRRGLAVKHLKDGQFGVDIADTVVRARISWDEEQDGRVPLLVIDGRPMTWDHLGRLLMKFEGFQFKLEIRDLSDEL